MKAAKIMAETLNPAFGQPDFEPRWTQGSKDGVGTAYAATHSNEHFYAEKCK